MNFPLISNGHIKNLDVGDDSKGLRKRFPNIWRLNFGGLTEEELLEVERFIRRMGTETLWSCDIGFRTFRDCRLIEARKVDWHGRPGISGWILFRGVPDSEASWANWFDSLNRVS